jgi:UPF0042 nucleotide-binding protein
MTTPSRPRRLVLLTGPSGAGLSTATGALEDAGFEAIDNLPMRLVVPLLDQPGSDRPMSLGLDMRNRDFAPQMFLDLVAELEQRADTELQVLYLDCRPEEILRRYSSTRRRHPIAEAPSLAEGIAREIEILRPIAMRADVLIDTSDLNPHELRAEVASWFVPSDDPTISVQIQSFSYKRGLPRAADMVFDCRMLRNPHWDAELRPKDGRDAAVQAYVAADDRFAEYLEKVRDLALFLLPASLQEGKSYLTIAFGCTGGKHRSVTMAERLSHALEAAGWRVSIRHRELDRPPITEAH